MERDESLNHDFDEALLEAAAAHPVLFVAIEWLEILPAEPQQQAAAMDEPDIDELRRRLQVNHIPFYEEAGVLRVVGHLRL